MELQFHIFNLNSNTSLQVISRKDQRQYWTQTDRAYSFVTVEEFAEAFQSFHVGKRLQIDITTPFDKAQSDPTLLTTKNYGAKKLELLKACFSKELLLMKRNLFVYIFKLVQVGLYNAVSFLSLNLMHLIMTRFFDFC